MPIVIAGVGGAFSVVAANSWMNQPAGFALDAAGNVDRGRAAQAMFNPAHRYEVPHMLLAAYMVRRLRGRLGLRGRACSAAAAIATTGSGC